MCGIAGVLNLDGRPADSELVARMTQRLRHRGPDDNAIHIDGAAGLGHTRLAIIDPAGGGQPMRSADGQLAVVCNGEIFNYVELRETLRAAGRRFVTHSDTEVILHAYAEYGDDCVTRFNGDFAFALLDRSRRRLFVARDRLGVRPLYFARIGSTLLFASEIKALLACDELPRAIDPLALDQIFTFWAPLPPRTVLQGISELPPAHRMVVADGCIKVSRYWDIAYDPVPATTDEDELGEALLELLDDATRIRLRSDVPVGAYLSGGLDSTVTTALACRALPRTVATFSLTFDDPEFDESGYQRAVVAELGTRHHTLRIARSDIGAAMPAVVRHAERPMLRAAPVPLFLLSRHVRDLGCKVVLTGEGADEMLGGYDIFKEAKLRRFCGAQPDSKLRPRLFSRLYPYLPQLARQSPAYLQAFFQVRPDELSDPFLSHRPRWDLTARLKTFLAPDLRARAASTDAVETLRETLPPDFTRWHPFNQAQYLETTMLLPGYILSTQGDRVAMAHAVEGRFPFLDHRLVEFASRLPVKLKMRGLREKHLLKRATRHLVPESVRRRSKQPYRAPDARSFVIPGRGDMLDYVDELLSPSRLAGDGLFAPAPVARLLAKVRTDQALSVKENMAFVGVLSTQLFNEQFARDGARWSDRLRPHVAPC